MRSRSTFLFAAGVAAASLLSPRLPARAQGATPPPDSAPPANVHERALTLGTGPWAVGATVSLPKGPGRFPAVVLIPGSGSALRDLPVGPNRVFREIAWGLAQKGIVTLRFDKRITAHPDAFRAVRHHITLDQEFTDDAVAAVESLTHMPEADPRRIFVLGHSQGTVIAPLVAERVPSVAGVVLVAVSSRPPDAMIEDQVRYSLSLAASDSAAQRGARETLAAVATMRDTSAPDTLVVLGRPLGWWRSMRETLPMQRTRAVLDRGGRALVVHGGRDFMVTDADFERWRRDFAAYRTITFDRFPNLNHLMQPGVGTMRPEEYGERRLVSPEFLNALASWIRADCSDRTCGESRPGHDPASGTADDPRLSEARLSSSACPRSRACRPAAR